MNARIDSIKCSNRQSILDLTHNEACTFLLKPESYCSMDLPPYIVFDKLINGIHEVLHGKKLADLRQSNPRDHDDVNYTILHSKDGKYSWRPFQLIHPALYVSLVHAITEVSNWQLIRDRFRQFALNPKIRCLSLPVVSTTDEKDQAEQISHWWQEVEQHSIELSLDYNYLIETDITDCYGAIYTHSIAWALHTKGEAKKKENRTDQNFIGNVIDGHIQDMRHGQTNGIPQGSTLMDFIAEMVLGFADIELSERLKDEGIADYQILRYRDDYRVFVNSPQVGEAIVKSITETTTGLGLKLSPTKTKASNDVVRASIKIDKLEWVARKQSDRSLQKHMLIIHDHAVSFPNAGSLVIALNDYHKRISRVKSLSENSKPLIAIVVDIAYRNPRTYAICAAILSKLLSFIEDSDERLSIAERIRKKFSQIPNTGHMQIWLQRVTFPLDRHIDYVEPVCKLVAASTERLWNNDWISSQALKTAVDATKIIDTKIREEMEPIIQIKEVELFLPFVDEGY
ncbi:MAG: RNA-directed DNA polymerase [Nitrospiraceae bacterium]|nr:RNA-directed DNA polymerase [Nitrospiraceae bacterium]